MSRQLRAPWQWGLNQGPAWRFWVRIAFWLGLAALAIGAPLRWLPPPVARPMATVLVALVIIVVFVIQIGGLLRLDHPLAARLVPGHAASLGRSAVALWAGCSLLLGVGTTGLLVAGDGGFTARLLPLACVGAGAVLLYFALALRWWILWWLPFAAVFLQSLPAGLRQTLRELVTSVDPKTPSLGLLCAAAMLAMAFAVASLTGRGGPAHRRAWTARERMRHVVEAGTLGHKPTLAAYGPWGERIGKPWQRLADAWLARATRQGSVMERIDIVINGSQHWVRQLAVGVPLMALVAAVLGVVALLGAVDPARMLDQGQVGLSVGLFSVGLGPLVGLNATLWFSRREQALLMLLPGVPRGARLNRSLGWLRARHFLVLWLLAAVPTAALAWGTQAAHLMAMPLAALAVLPSLWNDSARAARPGTWSAAWRYIAPLVLGLVSMALLREHPEAWGAWLAGLSALALGFGAWRWRRLARLPSALPAGRLA